MKSFRLFLLAFAATITIGAVAQDSVIPSRLRVQSIGVGTPAPSTNGDARANRIGVGTAATGAAGTITATLFSGPVSGDGSALTNLNATNIATGTLNNARLPAAISVTSVAATHTGDGSGLTALSAANISAGTLAVARGGTGVTASTGSGNVVLSTSPALTTPTVGGQQVCVANGTNCPADPTNTMAAAVISGVGSCSVSIGALRVSSCTRASAGVYNVNFSVSIGANNPACVVTVNNNAGVVRSAAVQTFNATRKDVRIVDGAGTATDANFEILCVAT